MGVYKKMVGMKSYSFCTDTIGYEAVETKSGKKYFVTGYISTKDRDLLDDIVTQKGLESMERQIKERSITLDYDHEAWRDNNTILPAGKIVDAHTDEVGLWVKAELNPASPKFKNLWMSIKGGFVTAFSIAFKPVKFVYKTMGNTTVRLLDDLSLLNVALTGAPVNTGARIEDVGMKSVFVKALNEMEDDNMVEDEDKKKKKKLEDEKEKEEPEEKAVEESKEDKEEDKKEVKCNKPGMKSEDNLLQAEIKSLKEEIDLLRKAHEEMKSKSVFKSFTPEQPPVVEAKARTPFDMIK